MTNLPPTVAASLFCYMDDEVDVWAASLCRAAIVFPHSDEWHQYCGLLEKTRAHKIPILTPLFNFLHLLLLAHRGKKQTVFFCFGHPVLVAIFTITPFWNF